MAAGGGQAPAPGTLAPALVLFARAARPGRVKTRLEPRLGRRGALLLHRALVADSTSLLKRAAGRCGARAYVAWTGRPRAGRALLRQGGGDLGARLRRVIRRLLRAGHRAVVVIGSDSPALPAARIVRAVRLLDRGADLVIGPARDGGYSLGGGRADRPALFERMPWGGDGVAARTLERAARLRLKTRRLPVFFDVDRPADLLRLRRALHGRNRHRAPRTAALLERAAGRGTRQPI